MLFVGCSVYIVKNGGQVLNEDFKVRGHSFHCTDGPSRRRLLSQLTFITFDLYDNVLYGHGNNELALRACVTVTVVRDR